MDQRACAKAGQQCLPARKRRCGRIQQGCTDDCSKPRQRRRLRRHGAAPCRHKAQSNHRPGKQLPDAGVRQEVGIYRVVICLDNACGQRQSPAGHSNLRQPEPRKSDDKPQRQRKHQIELLFDCQRPHVQQRLFLCRTVKIAGVFGKVEVGDEDERGERAAAKVAVVQRRLDEKAGDKAGQHHRQQGREQPPDAALVKMRDGKSARGNLRRNQPGDQVAGDDEEHIDANKTAGHSADAGMEQHDEHDRNGAQAVNVGAVALRMRGTRGGSFGCHGGRGAITARRPCKWRGAYLA